MPKQKVFITRSIPGDAIKILKKYFTVKVYPKDQIIPKKELIKGVKWCDALLCILTEKIDKDQQDRIYRNTVMNEKQARNIFRMNMKDKALSRSIEKTRSVNIDQNVRIKRNLAQTKQNILSIIEINKVTNQNKKQFQSENIKAGIKLTTGALVLKTFVISDQPILELDISDKGILFLKNVSYIEGFIAGVTGQIIRIINTGEEKIVLKNEAPNPTQQLKLHQDKVILEKNRGITLIFDGTFWRLLLN